MKNLLFVSAFIIAALSLQAQTEQGRWMLSLHNFSAPLSINGPTNNFGMGFGNTKTEDDLGNEESVNYSVVSLQSSFHYFLIDRLSGGLNLGYSLQTVDSESDQIYAIGPEVRYYIDATDKHKVYVYGGASWGGIKYSGFDDFASMSQYDAGVNFAMFLSRNFSFDMGFGYGLNIYDNDFEKTTTNGFFVDLGFSYFIGAGNE